MRMHKLRKHSPKFKKMFDEGCRNGSSIALRARRSKSVRTHQPVDDPLKFCPHCGCNLYVIKTAMGIQL